MFIILLYCKHFVLYAWSPKSFYFNIKIKAWYVKIRKIIFFISTFIKVWQSMFTCVSLPTNS